MTAAALTPEDLAPCFARAPGLLDRLEPLGHEAARAMSAAGLARWAQGARGLCALGRGPEPVLAWLEHMPAVVREVGEDALDAALAAALKLASMTSGEVIALMFASLPTAARRLGDPELFAGYLTLLHQLAARASRGLRPTGGSQGAT